MPPVAVGASETVPAPRTSHRCSGGWASGLSSARRKTSAGKARQRSTSPPRCKLVLQPGRPAPPQLPGDTWPRGLGPHPGGFPCPPVILAYPALPHFLLENPPGPPRCTPDRVLVPPRGSTPRRAVGATDSRGGRSPASGPGPPWALSPALSPPLVPAAGSLPLTRWLRPPP